MAAKYPTDEDLASDFGDAENSDIFGHAGDPRKESRVVSKILEDAGIPDTLTETNIFESLPASSSERDQLLLDLGLIRPLMMLCFKKMEERYNENERKREIENQKRLRAIDRLNSQPFPRPIVISQPQPRSDLIRIICPPPIRGSNPSREELDERSALLRPRRRDSLFDEDYGNETGCSGCLTKFHSMQLAAKKNQEQVALLKSSTDGKVDKHVLRNLIVGYFATPSDKQREVLRIIAEVLDFSSEERTRSGIDLHPGSWLSSIANFLAPPPSNIRIASKVDVLDHSSLSQAFIRFLEEESTPRFKPTLPAVQMAEEASLKAQKKALTKAGAKINPFVSVSDVTSTTMGSSLFAASVPSSLPTLQPVSLPSTQGLETQNSEAIVMQSSTTPTFTGSSGLDDSLHVNYPPSPSVSPTLSSSEQVSTSKFLNNLLNFDGVHPESGHS